VLVEAQRPARAQDPAGLGQCPGWVGTVHSTRLATTVSKAASGKGQVLGRAVDDLDGHPGRQAGLVGAGAHPWGGLQGHDPGGGAVQGQVAASSRADLQDLTGGLLGQAAAVVGAAEWVDVVEDPVVAGGAQPLDRAWRSG
jgi:hypothetical protein